ncbi:MAG: hypothetical protein LBF59_09225 [Prevotellaceae bacterium]|nr:hypothetical protein [Prevotellaceae bacterium]
MPAGKYSLVVSVVISPFQGLPSAFYSHRALPYAIDCKAFSLILTAMVVEENVVEETQYFASLHWTMLWSLRASKTLTAKNAMTYVKNARSRT